MFKGSLHEPQENCIPHGRMCACVERVCVLYMTVMNGSSAVCRVAPYMSQEGAAFSTQEDLHVHMEKVYLCYIWVCVLLMTLMEVALQCVEGFPT